MYGRIRYGTRIIAIGEEDQARLDRLCSRCRLRDRAHSGEVSEIAALRSLLVTDATTPRRSFHRSS